MELLDEDDGLEESGVDELDQMLAEAVEKQAAEIEFKRRKKEMARLPVAEREAAMKEYQRLSDARLWLPRANVALFHSQRCACGKDHAMFAGWFAEFRHKTDPFARRLVRGKSIESLPERMEIQFQGQVEMCVECVGGKVGVVDPLAGEEVAGAGQPKEAA